MPQYAIAQLGSCCRTPSNVLRAYVNQYEWIIATPRSNSACTLGSQEEGKLSLPSFSSCWPNALQPRATVMPAASIRYFRFMGNLPDARPRTTDALNRRMNPRMDVYQPASSHAVQGQDLAPCTGSSRAILHRSCTYVEVLGASRSPPNTIGTFRTCRGALSLGPLWEAKRT